MGNILLHSFSKAVDRGAFKVMARYRRNKPNSRGYDPRRGSCLKGICKPFSGFMKGTKGRVF